MIYVLALPNTLSILYALKNQPNNSLALIHVSRQLHCKFRPVLYRHSIFRIDIKSSLNREAAQEWLAIVNPNLFSQIPQLEMLSKLKFSKSFITTFSLDNNRYKWRHAIRSSPAYWAMAIRYGLSYYPPISGCQ